MAQSMKEKEYEKLLSKARSSLPPSVLKKDRFELPKPEILVSGNKTILRNFKEICDRLRRKQNSVLKFLSGGLGTSGITDGSRAVFKGRFRTESIEQLINRYIQYFLLCPVCGQPDTKIVKEGRFRFLVCEACGAKSSVRVT